MKLLIFFISAFLYTSCTYQNEAKKASDQYCNCMIENGYPDQNLYAVTICHAQLIKQYRFYKLFFIDRRNDVLLEKMSVSTLDSARKFVKEFLEYTQIDKRKILREIALSNGNHTDAEMISVFEDKSLNGISLPKPSIDKIELKNGLVKEEMNGYSETYYRNGKKDVYSKTIISLAVS